MVLQRVFSYPLQCGVAVLAALIVTCSGEGPLLTNPAEVDPILEPNIDQFWAIPLGRAGYPPLNEGNQPGPNPFPAGGQTGPASPGGAAFYPGPIPGSVQLGYFSGPPSYSPGNYGFNGNGVFGFSIPANALVQQQQSNNQQNSWGSGFWSRFNPANRVGSFFNFSQRQPVHQYAFSASITNQNNRQPTQNNPQQQQQQPPSNNPTATAPFYYPGYPQPSQNWYNGGGGGNYVPFGNPYLFSQNSQFSNSHNQQFQQQQQQFQQQTSDISNNADKNPSYNRPSLPVYNPPSSIPDNSEPPTNTSTDNSSTFSPSLPVRSGSSSETGRPGIWGENLRRNWLHVPWIGNLGNRDVSPRTDFPGATLFSFQG